jgi:two-component system invasion response regulator UvrY
MINVLLVEDQELVRTGIKALLSTDENITVTGLASTGEEAIEAVEELSPDVVLMDINMPGIGGVEACRRIIQRNTKVKIIALTVHKDGPVPQQLLKLGVPGFISKSSPAEEMVNAIEQVVSGKRYFCTDVANNLAFSSVLDGGSSPFDKLSQRETEVVSLILQGKTIKEMSDMLRISDKTINTYRYRIYDKLNIKNDVALTCMAVKFQFIDATLI